MCCADRLAQLGFLSWPIHVLRSHNPTVNSVQHVHWTPFHNSSNWSLPKISRAQTFMRPRLCGGISVLSSIRPSTFRFTLLTGNCTNMKQCTSQFKHLVWFYWLYLSTTFLIGCPDVLVHPCLMLNAFHLVHSCSMNQITNCFA